MKLPGSFDPWGGGWPARRGLFADTTEGDAGGGSAGAPADGGAGGGDAGAPGAGTGPTDPGAGASPAGGGAAPTDGAAAGDWTAGLSDKNRKVVEAQGIKSADQALDQYRELTKQNYDLNNKRIEVPGEDADQETKDKFFNALGRPETPEGYELAPPKEMPEGIVWSDAGVQAALPHLHAAGVTQDQASALVPAMIAIRKAERDQFVADRAKEAKDTRAALESGPDGAAWQGEGFDRNIQAIEDMIMRHPLGEKAMVDLEKSGWGNNVAILAVLHDLRVATSEDALISGETTAGQGQETAASLTAQQQEIEQEEGFNDRRHKNYRILQQKWKALQDRKMVLAEEGKEDVDAVVKASGTDAVAL